MEQTDSESIMEQAIEYIVENKLHEAMLSCWHLLDLDTNFPFFQAQERAALDKNSPYMAQRKLIRKALLENDPMRIRNLPRQYPLAFLEVLDEYLFLRFEYSARFSPPTKIMFKGEAYTFHRRVSRISTKTTHGSQTGHLQSWLRHFWIIPAQISGFEIRFRSVGDGFSILADWLKDEGIKIHVGSFPDDVEPLWLSNDTTKWSARKLVDPDKRWLSIIEVLKQAIAARADVVVFPELSICPILRERIRDWLLERRDYHPFLMLLPGSFHEEEDGRTFNIAELFNRSGKSLLRHRKMTRYGTQERQEAIETGNCIELLDTHIGLIGIPICLDFCQEGRPFSYLWEKIGVEWLLVPAFGDEKSISAHLRRAKELFRMHGTVSVIANQHPRGKDKDYGFVCHSGQAPRSATRNNRNYLIKIASESSDE